LSFDLKFPPPVARFQGQFYTKSDISTAETVSSKSKARDRQTDGRTEGWDATLNVAY